jgi:hypothetical protein
MQFRVIALVTGWLPALGAAAPQMEVQDVALRHYEVLQSLAAPDEPGCKASARVHRPRNSAVQRRRGYRTPRPDPALNLRSVSLR